VAALGDQRLGVIRVFDILVSTIAARMAGDQLIVEVAADSGRIGFYGRAAMRVAGRDGIPLGLVEIQIGLIVANMVW
jgi:hypothetical protein